MLSLKRLKKTEEELQNLEIDVSALVNQWEEEKLIQGVQSEKEELDKARYDLESRA